MLRQPFLARPDRESNDILNTKEKNDYRLVIGYESARPSKHGAEHEFVHLRRRILTCVFAGSPSMPQPYPVKCLSARDVVILVKRHREDRRSPWDLVTLVPLVTWLLEVSRRLCDAQENKHAGGALFC